MFKDFIAPIIGFLLIVAGWFVVARQNDRREQRKEVRAILNDIRKLVMEIEGRAFEYYRLAPDKSLEAGTLLKQQLKHVSAQVTSLTHQNSKFDVSALLAGLRKTITGGDFESFMRPPRVQTDPLMNAIALSVQEFLDELERIFATEYSGK